MSSNHTAVFIEHGFKKVKARLKAILIRDITLFCLVIQKKQMVADMVYVKQHFLFIVFCLVLTLGLLQSYSAFRDYFSDSHDLQKELAVYKLENERQNLRVSILEKQMLDFKIEVAKTLPVENFESKRISQVVRLPASERNIDLSSVQMQKGREQFNQKNYLAAIVQFKKLIQEFPTSPNVVEAQFLLAESYFLAQQYPQALDEIDKMMTQFPEDDLTGFIMIRMGQISLMRGRSDEALEIFKVIQWQFKDNSLLQEQTAHFIKNIESL